MIVTEEEAKTKWCRHVVASHTNPRMGFAGDTGPRTHNCIGSECMAWEWVGGWSRDDRSGLNGPITPAKGYCGAK